MNVYILGTDHFCAGYWCPKNMVSTVLDYPEILAIIDFQIFPELDWEDEIDG